MKMPRFCSALLPMVLAAIFLARSAAATDAVIVPYDPTKPVAGQQPDQFYLPYERFLELWEKAKLKRKGAAPEMPATAWSISSARYEGRVEDRSLIFTGTLDVSTRGQAWVKVPLEFRDVKISRLIVDGVPGAFDGASVLIEKPGRHRIEVSFEIPRGSAANEWSWGVPRSAATMAVLTLPDGPWLATFSPGDATIERAVEGRRTVSASLGTTADISLRLESIGAAERVAEPAVATVTSVVRVSAGLERVASTVEFSFPKARQDRFEVRFPAGSSLSNLVVEDVKSWRLVPEGDQQRLEVVLNGAAAERFEVALELERPLEVQPGERIAPVVAPKARRVEQTVVLVAEPRVEVTARPEPALRQVSWEGKVTASERLVAAYAGAGALRYEVARTPARREARIDYVYQVNRRKIELIASLQLDAKGDAIDEASVTLPPEFEVHAVQGDRLAEWWREGDKLSLRFHGATPETTPLVIYLVRQYATAPTDLELRPLQLEGFRQSTGGAVIAAHKSVDVGLKLDGAREVEKEKAAVDFQILAPLERKRGFTFANQNFSGQVTLKLLAAQTEALWVLHAQVHEGWIALSTKARISMRQGSIERASFTLPAALPEARVGGGEVRETRSRVEGAVRVYDVQFQSDVTEAVDFTIDLDLPLAGELVLPHVEFPGAQFTSGYVLTDNVSEFEMKLTTGGVDPAPTSKIPWLPALTKSAGVFSVHPNWSVSVNVERLEKAAQRAAFCAWAELTTALRRDGTEWHRASWRLQNRSLQFLPVKLPEGAELMGARVAGQSVRADKGMVDRQNVVLVPLIKTKPGDLSYDVEVVYRRAGAELGWRSSRALDDPELVGITVERTIWNLWLPEDRDLGKVTGNMEPVLEEVNKTEKLEGELAELKVLSSLVSSAKVSEDTRRNARSNFARLRKSIEEKNSSEADSYNFKSGKPAGVESQLSTQALDAQNKLVGQKQRRIAEELTRESEQVDRLEQAEAAQPAPVAAVPQAGAQAYIQNQQASDRWSANGDYAQRLPAPKPVQPAAPGSNFYLNDNVVLQQKEALGDKRDKKPNGPEPDFAAKKKEAEMFAQNGFDDASRPEKPAKQPAADDGKGGKDRLLSTARGNRVQQEAQLFTENAQGAPAQSAPAVPPPVNGPQGVVKEDAKNGAIGNVENSTVDADGRAAAAAGRISLAVDFPTEGRVYHFKKVKANAALDVRVVAPEAFRRWKWLGVFAASAFVYWLMGRVQDKRRAAAR